MQPDYKTTQLQGIADLTLTAPIKGGFVEGAFEAETHVERLRRVLGMLSAVRQFSREVALQASPFADSVGKFRAIHFFRFAIVAPDAGTGGPHKLFLNVTFDGGWEQYMRIIWGPLGTLLDLIFCNCEGYKLAYTTSFAEYMKWVRDNEKPSSFFYADSAATVADAQYLAQLDALERERGGLGDADARATKIVVAAQPPAVIQSAYAAQASIRVLKAIAALRGLFRPTPRDDQGVLLRFAHNLLSDLRGWIAQGLFDPGQVFDQMRSDFDTERVWFMIPRYPPLEKKDWRTFDLKNVQAGIAMPFKSASQAVHGALVLLRITNVSEAMTWLATCAVADGTDPGGGHVTLTLGLTFPGMARLGVHAEWLERLPREFAEGMEARAGILGDVRGNHPQYWRRPRRNWLNGAEVEPFGQPVALSSVHVLVQLRTTDAAAATDKLLARLIPEVGLLEDLPDGRKTGLSVLSVQVMAQQPPLPGEPFGRGHFGYADGASQPRLTPAPVPPSYWNDVVKKGELFLGYINDRGDGPGVDAQGQPVAEPNLLLDDGSFLVVRKLRQHADRLEQAVAGAVAALAPEKPAAQAALVEELRAKLMGRSSAGEALIPLQGPGGNDFNYRQDTDGAACPFAAHIRRANPREPRPSQMPPRIARRGMSYGQRAGAPTDDYGLVFMAYNASIAEQFEVIQRWLAGGNSTGASSAADDPFVGVPEAGRSRIFRFVRNGQVVRIDLGAKPLAELQWGVYAFVPSLAALQALASFVTPPPLPKAEPPAPPPDAKEVWKRRLEDGGSRDAAWREVRQQPDGVLETEYGWLVGTQDSVLSVLKDRGDGFSVSGYGKRMAASIGHGYLGQDDDQSNVGHRAPYVALVNEAIEASVPESTAYELALNVTRKVLDQMVPVVNGHRTATINIELISGAVIARLCTEWFGLPDGVHVKAGARSDDASAAALCPGHLLSVARYVFSPDPSPIVEEKAQKQGVTYLSAVADFLRSGQYTRAPVTKAIVEVLPNNIDLQATTVAGVMLGFPPTVLGNLISVVVAANRSRALWDWQQDLIDLGSETHAAVAGLLHQPLLDTMRLGPVPYMDWRTAGTDCKIGKHVIPKGKMVVIGLGSAAKDRDSDARLMFGGARDRGPGATDLRTVHACPGYGMAVGVMLGVIAALLTAGDLRPTADPRVFSLTA